MNPAIPTSSAAPIIQRDDAADTDYAVSQRLMANQADPAPQAATQPAPQITLAKKPLSERPKLYVHWPTWAKLIANGEYEACKELLEKNMDPNFCGGVDGNNSVHLAVIANQPRLIELFIQYDGNVNAQNKMGNTPLHLAAFKDNPFAAEILIANGADLEIKNKAQETPLEVAVCNNIEDVPLLLIEAGANIATTSHVNGKTLLHEAASNGNVKLVEALLSKGANIKALALDAEGNQKNVLSFAMDAPRSLFKKITHLLIEWGADVNVAHPIQKGPLIFVIDEIADLELPRLLLQKGADVDHIHKGQTPLSLAISKKSMPLVCEILKYKPDITSHADYPNRYYYAGKKSLIEMTKIIMPALVYTLFLRGAPLDGSSLDTCNELLNQAMQYKEYSLVRKATLAGAKPQGPVYAMLLQAPIGPLLSAINKQDVEKVRLYCALLAQKSIEKHELLEAALRTKNRQIIDCIQYNLDAVTKYSQKSRNQSLQKAVLLNFY